MTVSFGTTLLEVADVRDHWALGLDGLPYCQSCRQELQFWFSAPAPALLTYSAPVTALT